MPYSPKINRYMCQKHYEIGWIFLSLLCKMYLVVKSIEIVNPMKKMNAFMSFITSDTNLNKILIVLL